MMTMVGPGWVQTTSRNPDFPPGGPRIIKFDCLHGQTVQKGVTVKTSQRHDDGDVEDDDDDVDDVEDDDEDDDDVEDDDDDVEDDDDDDDDITPVTPGLTALLAP